MDDDDGLDDLFGSSQKKETAAPEDDLFGSCRFFAKNVKTKPKKSLVVKVKKVADLFDDDEEDDKNDSEKPKDVLFET